MPKIYSNADKEELRNRLLESGLHLLATQGYRNTDMQAIAKRVGVSRSFFYSLFASREEFVLAAFALQQATLEQMLQNALAQTQLTMEQRIQFFLQDCMANRSHAFFYMTQEDQIQIYRTLSPQSYQQHQQSELAFYRRMILAVGRNPEVCRPEVVGNLVLTLLLTINSLSNAPFMFRQNMKETIDFQYRSLYDYIFAH